jgi:predicted Zn-dependent peptidase
MRCFHRTHYQPENMTVVIIGGVDRETAIALISEAFGSFGVRSECPPLTPHPLPHLDKITRTELRLPRLEQARLLLAWTAPGVDLMDVGIGLDMLSVLLAGGRSSRLVRDLREEQQCVWDVGSEFSLQKNASLLTINAWLDDEQLPAVEAKLQAHLHHLQTTPISSGEINRIKRLLCNDYAFSTETPAQLAGLYGYYNTIAQAELAVTYAERVQRMTPDILQQIAQDYLKPDCYAATVMRSL